ncbi:MAG: hypothetical protein NC206_08490 [Bacteroides sp.]|nr:hypothetical protein [Roseburia sp.]MCM1347107.1 hypothetical protein [Bacteroides sp.]MCM1420711.1 hypothetical protein [Bacteroides sp.]
MKHKLLDMLFLMAVTAVLFACSLDGEEADLEYMVEDNGYISVGIKVASGVQPTRSADSPDYNPDGGEDGEGREDGVLNENNIYNVTLLLYKDGNAGINSTNEPVIDFAVYFPVMSKISGGYGDVAYRSQVVKMPKEVKKAEYHIVAIANAGDLTGLKGMKLSEVRDYPVSKVWSGCDFASLTQISNMAACDCFVMTSEKDAVVDLTAQSEDEDNPLGSESNPFMAEVDIERMAARIDIEPADKACRISSETEMEGCPYYEYKVVSSADKTTETGDIFRLTHVMPVNCLNESSFLIKRVTASVADEAKTVYLGDERKDINGHATNFVIDPWTSRKNSSFAAIGIHALNTSLLINDDLQVDDKYRVVNVDNLSYPHTVGYSAEHNNHKYYILGYTMENTLPQLSGPNDNRIGSYATGIVIKGKYYSAKTATWSDKVYIRYLLHAAPEGYEGTADTEIMKYGVVRNNIYRICIENVEMTDDEDTGVVISVKVKKWDVYKHDVINM